MNIQRFSIAVIVCLSLSVMTAHATPIIATATLDSAQEPGNISDSTAVGGAVLAVIPETGLFNFNLEVTGIRPSDLVDLGIAPTISSIHLHNAPAGENGPVVVDLGGGNTNSFVEPLGNGGFSINIEGEFFGGTVGDDLDAANANLAALLTDNLYINIHTTDFRGGEIRGQLGVVQSPRRVPEPASLVLAGVGLVAMTCGRRRVR